MRLLFLSFLAKTLHETAMGLDLADQLRKAGVESCFLIDRFSADQLREAGYPHRIVTPGAGTDLVTAVADAIGDWRPDALVPSDFIGYWTSCHTAYEVDPWFIDAFDLPVVPLDPYDMGPGQRQVELLGRVTPIGDRIAAMPRLRPVPSGRLTGVPGDPAVPYRATATLAPPSAAARDRVRHSLGLSGTTRLLMIPTLPWQEAMLTRAGPATRELAARIPELVLHYLTRLPAATEFLVAGPDFGAFGRLPEGRLHRRPHYSAREYLDLLGAADAVLALSLPSFALERAVWADVPGVAVVNGFDLADDTGIERLHAAVGEPSSAVRSWLDAYPGALPSYQAWPLRWNDLVRPMLSGNPFADTMAHAEILDERSVITTLEAVLYDEPVRAGLAEARAGYRRALTALPDTAEAFQRVASVHGLTF